MKIIFLYYESIMNIIRFIVITQIYYTNILLLILNSMLKKSF